MYKYLLCWRYLRTRYIALASVISVMLGVATMIVVNSVMAGFADKMRDRLHGILADLVVESASMDGFYNFEEVMARVQEAGGDDVVAMAPTMETPGILKYRVGSESMTKLVQIIGVRPAERARTGDFAEFLFDEKGRPVEPSFEVPDRLREKSPAGSRLKELEGEEDDEFTRAVKEQLRQQAMQQVPDQGAIIGYALGTWHPGKGQPDVYLAHVGTKINLAFPKAGKKPEAGSRRLHGGRLLQERHERVRLDARLRPPRAAPEVAASCSGPTARGPSTRSRSRSSRA